jgi:hypothetical protein
MIMTTPQECSGEILLVLVKGVSKYIYTHIVENLYHIR